MGRASPSAFNHDWEIRERVTVREPLGRDEVLMRMATDNIRHFTKKPKKIVAKWVSDSFPTDTGDSFVLGIPMSVLDVILAGVAWFTQ